MKFSNENSVVASRSLATETFSPDKRKQRKTENPTWTNWVIEKLEHSFDKSNVPLIETVDTERQRTAISSHTIGIQFSSFSQWNQIDQKQCLAVATVSGADYILSVWTNTTDIVQSATTRIDELTLRTQSKRKDQSRCDRASFV